MIPIMASTNKPLFHILTIIRKRSLSIPNFLFASYLKDKITIKLLVTKSTSFFCLYLMKPYTQKQLQMHSKDTVIFYINPHHKNFTAYSIHYFPGSFKSLLVWFIS